MAPLADPTAGPAPVEPPDTRGPSRGGSLLLAVAAGGALWTAFPDVAAWPMAFAAVGLLYAALGRRGHRAAGWNALVGFVAAMTFWLPHIWWANLATDTVPWIALATLQSSFWALLGAAWTWARRTRLLDRGDDLRTGSPRARHAVTRAGAFAVVFGGVEELRASVPFGGFPWGRIAWSMVDAPLGRAAWLGSTTLVSVLVVLTGVLAALAVAAAWRAVRGQVSGRDAWLTPTVLGLAAGAIVLVPAWLPLPSGEPARSAPPAGVVDAGLSAHEVPGPPLLAGAVQGNVADPSLGSAANLDEVLNNHLDGTYRLADLDLDLDVVLWPENGSDADPQEVATVGRAIDAAATAVGAPILVGAQEFPETGGRYNVSLLWEPGTGVIDRYAKQRPAPFGEYIPLRSVARVFSDQVDRVRTDMIAGGEPAVVDLPRQDAPTVPLATIICFEVAYDSLVRDAVSRGAQLLVVPTNNASFGYSAESTQQLAMTRMQAMITGRAAVQISTVGVSGIVAPDGTLLAATELFTADELVAALPLRTTLTPAVRAGAWPAGIIGVLAVGLVAWGIAGTVRDRPTRRSAA